MHGLDVIIRKNNQATERELNDALTAGDINLALRIADAVIGDALAAGVHEPVQNTEYYGLGPCRVENCSVHSAA